MFTRVIATRYEPGMRDEITRTFRESVLPEARQQKGFQGGLLLTNEATNKAIAASLWETEQDVQASETSGYLRRQLAKLAHMLSGEPAIETYPVSVFALTGGMAHAARVVYTQLQAGKAEEATRIYQDSILPEAYKQQGFQGALLLTDSAAGKGISITFWETEANRLASETSGYFQAQLAKLSHLLTAEPVREVYAVSLMEQMGAPGGAGMPASAEANKRLVRRYFEEIWNKGNLAVADELIAPTYVDHDPASPGVNGPEGVKQLVMMYRRAFPDVHISIEEQIAEGDTVATHWVAQGTHQGDLQGIPPTGKRATVTGTQLSHIAGGKIAEDWGNWDTLGLLQQLGVLPQMGQAMPMQQPGMEPPPIHG